MLLLALSIMGCSDLSVFSPGTGTTAAVEIRSLNEGGVVGPGQSVSFVVHQEGKASSDLQLEITLTDSEGNGVWSRTLSDPAVNEELELVLPELETGQYEIQFQVGTERSSADRTRLSFFYVQGNYAVTGLSSYPPSTLPGAEIVVQADLEVPAGADPYVRWTQGDTVLARGLVSDGLAAITWKAPREPGVYPVTVELFPVPPAGAADFPFSSALAMTARLYIGAGARPADALLPESSYYSLFHFDGSLIDRGMVASGDPQDGTVAELFGGAALVAGPPVAGLRIESAAGMSYPRLILPGGGSEGFGHEEASSLSAAWTLTLALRPEGEQREAVLLTTRSSDGGLGLTLAFDAEGILGATLRGPMGAAAQLPSGMGPLEPDTLQRVDLSLYARKDTVTALWFLDGRQTAAVVRTLSLGTARGTAGETTLGGERGFSGIVAELGVYFQDEFARPSVDPGIYRAAMRSRFGASLILAEGFEGLYLPAEFVMQGSAFLDKGALILGREAASGEPSPASARGTAASAVLETPLFELKSPSTVIELESRAGYPNGTRITLQWEGQLEGFAELRIERAGSGEATGLLLDPQGSNERIRTAPLPDSLRLRLDGQALSVGVSTAAAGGEERPAALAIRRPDEVGSWLKLTLSVPAGGSPLELDRLLIYGAPQP